MNNGENKISYKIARLISDIFVPPTISLISFLFLTITFSRSTIEFIFSFVISILATVILPIIYFIIKRKKGAILNNDATIKEERQNPFIFSLLLVSAGVILMIVFAGEIYSTFFLSVYITTGIIVLIVNRYYKISIHSLGVAGGVGLFLHFSALLSVVFIIVLILVMWSRVRLKVHTISQVIAGAMVGLAVTYFQIKFLIEIFIK